jgi:predicted Ser/Thr protein kinase
MASIHTEKIEHLSSKRAFFSTAQAGQKIFFIGGFEFNDFIASKTIDVYNLASGSWEPSVNLTTARGRISSIVLGPRIYMAGGQAYTNVPLQYSAESNNFISDGFTSGPTVRRPVRLALHNNTLTAIGYFSVDFMDTNTKIWTHNEKLTSVMSTLFDTTTVAHNNFVLVIGGTNGTNQLPSLSAWVVDTPTSNPIEFKNITTSPASTKQFIGSWFDEAHEAVVIQFSNQCLVFHTDSQTWLQRDTINNNSVSSVSYQNNTIVFFSDGYWTIDWHLMNDTWTSHDQITFAFSIADQFVFGNEEQMSIVTPESTLTQPIELGTPALSIAASSSSYIIVNSSCAFFAYNSDTKQLVLLNYPLNIKPANIFRDNNSQVHLIGQVGENFYIATVNGSAFLRLANIPWVPDALIQNNFFNFALAQSVPLNNTVAINYLTTSLTSSIWTQQGEQFYLMRTSLLNANPLFFTTYLYLDVYNYVENKWESSIPTPFFLYAHSYMYTFILGNSLHVASRPNLYRLNETENWVRSVGYPVIYSQSHATYSPPPVMDDAVYLMDNGAGLFIISIDMAIQRVRSEVTGIARQAVATNTSIIMPIWRSPYFTDIVIYDILSDRWQGTIFQTNDVMVSIIPYDDWVLSFGDNSTYFSYLDLSSIGWGTEPFDNSFVPASLFTLSTLSNRTTLVIAGGYHRIGWYYTDQVRFVTLDLAPVIVPVASQQPSSPSTTPQEPDNNDLTTIVVATVIPIVVVVVVAVFLTIFLLRRKERRRKQSAVTMIGLEQQFGEWFTPFNDIKFGEQLGQGGSGQVFKGKWKNTDVALKVSMTQANQSVIAELSLMINLRPHPNVVQLFGYSVHPETNSIILILEFCNGGSLDDYLVDQKTAISAAQKIQMLQGIARGIVHLHSNNIVHRDLAARNVLLHQGEPKITDFGMSRVVDEHQRGTTKSELGPIRWMAPESLKNKQYSTKSGTSIALLFVTN